MIAEAETVKGIKITGMNVGFNLDGSRISGYGSVCGAQLSETVKGIKITGVNVGFNLDGSRISGYGSVCGQVSGSQKHLKEEWGFPVT
ncbi:hypothetical protein Tco_1400017 [Tanacetum coccineum]